MTLIRNDQQVALNDLLVATEKSSDHYRDAADYLKSFYPGEKLVRIAEERDKVALRLEESIRESDDLPTAPDEDRESIEKLIHRVHASLSHNEIRDLLQQRLDADRTFAAQVQGMRQEGWAREKGEVLLELEQHLRTTIEQLTGLIESIDE